MGPNREQDATDTEAEGGICPSRLLTLPQEVRDNIYEHLLISFNFVIDIQDYLYDKHVPSRNHVRGDPNIAIHHSDARVVVSAYAALSATCRQLYDEVKSCFFETNTFATSTDAHCSIRALCNRDLMRVRHLVLYRYVTGASRPGSTNIVPVALDITLTGAAIGMRVTSGDDTLMEAVLAAYPGRRASSGLVDRDRKKLEEHMQPTVMALQRRVAESEGKLTRAMVDMLKAALRKFSPRP